MLLGNKISYLTMFDNESSDEEHPFSSQGSQNGCNKLLYESKMRLVNDHVTYRHRNNSLKSTAATCSNDSRTTADTSLLVCPSIAGRKP